MSKQCIISIVFLLLWFANLSLAGQTYTNLIETTYDDPNWVLVISDGILRKDVCGGFGYEKVFNPCYNWNRYWKLPPYTKTGKAFSISLIQEGTTDSLYVRDGFDFQLYDNTEEPNDLNDLVPYGPYMSGPKYVSIDHWRGVYEFEPGTFLVYGNDAGYLEYYSIIISANSLRLLKTDDVNDGDCVYPYDIIEYQIVYENLLCEPNDPNDPDINCVPQDAYNVVITDFLSTDVDFYWASDGGVYDANERTVTWDIGDVEYGDSNCFQLKTKVNYWAKPSGIITNDAQIEGDGYFNRCTTDVNVCAYGGEIIYVDKDANDFNNGTNWDDAYTDLQEGLTCARNCGTSVTAIWVAAGTYKPTNDPEDTTASFELVNGVPLYGGFAGDETSRDQRDLSDANNETVLTGDIDNDGFGDTTSVVTVPYVDRETILDGFTIEKGSSLGVYAHNSNSPIISSPTISNCKIRENSGRGIQCEYDSEPNIISCEIYNNSQQGIMCYYSSANIYNCHIHNNNNDGISAFTSSGITVIDCLIEDNSGAGIMSGGSSLLMNNRILENGDDGIYAIGSPVIKNNIITGDNSNSSDTGMRLKDLGVDSVIRNNTIVYETGRGIYFIGTPRPVTNCIIQGSDSLYLDYDTVEYSCIKGGYSGSGQGNIDVDPCFVNPDANNFHLKEESACIDAGDPNFEPEPNETDLDGEDRIKFGRVDIGADEFHWSLADFDRDGFVDFFDYAMFANNWRKTDADGDYDDFYDIADDNNSVDFNEVAVIVEDWLWEKVLDEGWMMRMGGGGMGGEGFSPGAELYPAEFTAEQSSEEMYSPDIENIERLLEWLEDIWLDESVQETIDEDNFKRMIESLKKLL